MWTGHRRPGPYALLAIAAAGVTALTACSQSDETTTSSGGACAAPRTHASTSRVSAGQALTLTAAGMWDGCNDQGTSSQLPPLTRQRVTWTQGARTQTLATVDADGTGQARTTITIPAIATPGTARLTIGIADPVTVTIVPSAP